MKIVSVGEITVDRYLKQDFALVGGISLNFAVQAKRFGAENASLVSCVGDHPLGAWVLETLATEQIDTSQIAILPGETAECDIAVDENAERSFPGYRVNVLSQLELTEPIKQFICAHDVVATQYDGEAADSMTTQLIQLPKADLKRVVDFGDWSAGREKSVTLETLNAIDLAFFSGDEETIGRLQALAEQAACLTIVTLGAGGSMALTTPERHFQAAVQVDQLVDTTGCGDAFQAAFTTSYFRDGDIPAALFHGAHHASKVLKHFGAFSQPPRTENKNP